MRISDWSSDVCSSDLGALFPRAIAHRYLDRGADGAAARPLRYDETRLAVRFGRLHALSGAERARPFSRGFRRARAGQTSGGAGRMTFTRETDHGTPPVLAGGKTVRLTIDGQNVTLPDRKSPRLNSSHYCASRLTASD